MSTQVIPSAKDFISNIGVCKSPVSGLDSYLKDDVEAALIEFAKLHVKAALEAAIEDSPHGSSTDIPTYEDMKKAILESYPLTSII